MRSTIFLIKRVKSLPQKFDNEKLRKVEPELSPQSGEIFIVTRLPHHLSANSEGFSISLLRNAEDSGFGFR